MKRQKTPYYLTVNDSIEYSYGSILLLCVYCMVRNQNKRLRIHKKSTLKKKIHVHSAVYKNFK